MKFHIDRLCGLSITADTDLEKAFLGFFFDFPSRENVTNKISVSRDCMNRVIGFTIEPALSLLLQQIPRKKGGPA